MTVSRLFVFATAVLAASCGNKASSDRKPGSHHYRLYFDESDSVNKKQKALWPSEAARLAGRLQYGDAIEVNRIHARTADAAPLFRAEIPVFDENTPRSAQEGAKRELHRIRREAKLAIAEAIHPSEKLHVRATDVFGAFDRFRSDPSREGSGANSR